MKKIIIRRQKQYTDMLRKYDILVDWNNIGNIWSWEEKIIEVENWKHEIQISIDWCKSNIIELWTSENGDVILECGSNVKWLKLLLALLYTTIWKNEYLYIKII